MWDQLSSPCSLVKPLHCLTDQPSQHNKKSQTISDFNQSKLRECSTLSSPSQLLITPVGTTLNCRRHQDSGFSELSVIDLNGNHSLDQPQTPQFKGHRKQEEHPPEKESFDSPLVKASDHVSRLSLISNISQKRRNQLLKEINLATLQSRSTPYFYAYTAAYHKKFTNETTLDDNQHCPFPIMSRPYLTSNGSTSTDTGQNSLYSIPSEPLTPKRPKNSDSPFTRSQCLGGKFCQAGCLLHKKKRRRPLKSAQQIPADDHSDVTNFDDYCPLYSDDDEGIFDDDEVEEISVVRTIRNYFFTHIHKISQTLQPSTEVADSYPSEDLNSSNTATPQRSRERSNHSTPRNHSPIISFNANPSLFYLFFFPALLYMFYFLYQNGSSLPSLNDYFPSTETQSKDVQVSSKSTLPSFHFSHLSKQIKLQFEQNQRRVRQLESLIENQQQKINLMNETIAGLFDFIKSKELDSHKTSNNHNEIDNVPTPYAINNPSINLVDVQRLIKLAIAKYDADKTGLTDFALESSGAQVISIRCSKTFDKYGTQYKILGIPFWHFSSSPRTVIQPSMAPGECWPFIGAQGFLVIKLSQLIVPTNFSYEHIPVQISREGNLNSAPREFEVRSLEDEADQVGLLLGKYVYDSSGDPLQFFTVQHPNPKPTQHIELIIHGNHGHLEYTCLYRFRVHGERINF